jgi:hypothetical protein
MKNAFLVFSVLGAAVPYIFFTTFFAEEGTKVRSFIAALFVNGAAGGFTANLLISSFAF